MNRDLSQGLVGANKRVNYVLRQMDVQRVDLKKTAR